MYTNLKFLNLMYAIVPDRIIRKYKKKNEILNKSTNWPLSDKKDYLATDIVSTYAKRIRLFTFRMR